jgi:hypothetical protein
LLRVPEDRVIELLGLYSGPFHCSFGSNGCQVLRREVAQFATVAAHGRAGSTDNCDVTWFQHWVPCSENFGHESQTLKFISGP